MHNYRVVFGAHRLVKNKLLNSTFYRFDLMKSLTLLEAFHNSFTNRLNCEKTNLQGVVSIAAINKDAKLPPYVLKEDPDVINPYDRYKRKFVLHYITRDYHQKCVGILANDVIQAISIWCLINDKKLDENIYPDEYISFQLWEPNWRLE